MKHNQLTKCEVYVRGDKEVKEGFYETEIPKVDKLKVFVGANIKLLIDGTKERTGTIISLF